MRLYVKSEGKFVYDIVSEKDFSGLRQELLRIGAKGRKLCLVTDSHVQALYGAELEAALLPDFSLFCFVFPAGEASKNLDVVKDLYGFLIEHAFDRKDMLLALGGGVVGDLCGFAAATYLRGIDFVQIPTTLLAQVDSGIGGKTGVDFAAYKNMVGAFHFPKLVYINISTLQTLPDAEYASGMAEVIKHALIRDKGYYDFIRQNKEKIKARDKDVLTELVLVSDKIKAEVVELDPKEKGLRGILNFGHTLGHAIEKHMEFGMSHGACVALGMICALQLSVDRKGLSPEKMEECKEILAYFSLPLCLEEISEDVLLTYTQNDKKMEAGQIKFILLREIGEAYIDKSVTPAEMRASLRSIKGE